MITAWELYLWTRLDLLASFRHVGFVLLVCHLFYLPMVMFVKDCSDIENPLNFVWRFARVTIAVVFVFISVGFLTPNRKDAAMIWVIPKLATVENAELLQGEAAEIYKLAKDALKESIGAEEKE